MFSELVEHVGVQLLLFVLLLGERILTHYDLVGGSLRHKIITLINHHLPVGVDAMILKHYWGIKVDETSSMSAFMQPHQL